MLARPFLIGPVATSWVHEHLPAEMRGPHLHSFGWRNESASLDQCHGWADLLARLPAGAAPEYLLLLCGDGATPSWLLDAPIPIVALAINPAITWHHLRSWLWHCEGVITAPACQSNLS